MLSLVRNLPGQGKLQGSSPGCPRATASADETPAQPGSPWLCAVPGTRRSCVYHRARPSPCRFFLPAPWILKWTWSSQSLRKQGCAERSPSGVRAKHGRGAGVSPRPPPPRRSPRGSHHTVPDGALPAALIGRQADVLAGDHGAALEIPQRHRGRARPCNEQRESGSARAAAEHWSRPVPPRPPSRSPWYGFISECSRFRCSLLPSVSSAGAGRGPATTTSSAAAASSLPAPAAILRFRLPARRSRPQPRPERQPAPPIRSLHTTAFPPPRAKRHSCPPMDEKEAGPQRHAAPAVLWAGAREGEGAAERFPACTARVRRRAACREL